MKSVLVLLILLSVRGFLWQQHVSALQASTVQVRYGEDAILQCPLMDAFSNVSSNTFASSSASSNASSNASSSASSSVSFSASSTLSWYRKAAGRSPELLLSFRSSDVSNVTYGPGVSPDKVSASVDGSLLLHDSRLNDSAVYYCGLTRGEEKKRATP
ncbi:T cell receptor beta variable 11-1 [Dissostichus eleginoides]|nr:T cell receptor beta variable 11-1 [Dissostichus eleginoides]